MTAFQVRPESLDGYAQALSQGRGAIGSVYLNDAQTYVGSWIRLDGNDGGILMKAIVDATGKVHQALETGNMKLSTAADSAGENLAASAAVYRKTDLGAARKVDAVYKPTGVPALDAEIDPVALPFDPVSRLTTPGTDGGEPDLVGDILGATDWVDVGSLALKIIGWFGLHPDEWLTERFLGDFTSIARVKNALASLSQFDSACAANVAHGMHTLQGSWTGNAATAAGAYFDDLANAMQARSDTLHDLSGTYDGFLAFLQSAKNTIGGILSGIIDLALQAASEVAAAGCLVGVPVVGEIIMAISASTVARLIGRINDIKDAWSVIMSTLNDTIGAIGVVCATLANWDASVRLPKGTYFNGAQTDHPVTSLPTPRTMQ